ncbi:MAG: twin-arginine translocase TatA/TatE family subunit [Acidobacteriota bacterium]|jgi:sec-independent protein translocase protein TatA|nr:twin-arginine translocase TatA/TatE family subunit [Acidobacteriota bacterium]
MLGTTEIILIVLALFLLFGASRLPKLAKSLGQSRMAFKEGLEEAEREFKGETDEPKSIDAPSVSRIDAPSISTMSDDDLAAEMRRRAEAKQT